MTDNENINVDQNSEAEDGVEKATLSRRNFLLKSALVSVPVVMSVMGKSAYGTTDTLSGCLSGVGSHPGRVCAKIACSPGYWHKYDHWYNPKTGQLWAANSRGPRELFDTVFNVTAFPGATLLEVCNKSRLPALRPANCTTNNLEKKLILLGFHAVAALQNSLVFADAKLGYPVSDSDVKRIFSEGLASYNSCNPQGIIDAKDLLEAPYLTTHACLLGVEDSYSNNVNPWPNH